MKDLLKSENENLRRLLTAASHALRSYQYGNTGEDLAEEIADEIDKALAPKIDTYTPIRVEEK